MAETNGQFDYSALLSKAKGELPEPTSSGERWEPPIIDVMEEGRFTVIRNWADIVEAVRRDSEHVLTYILRELGTAGTRDGDRVTLQGNIGQKNLQERLNAYVQTFVVCPECGRPDTHLDRQERTTLLKCEACGAHKPVVSRRARPAAPVKPSLQEGQVYEVTVEDVSQRGDGVARMFGTTIFVPGGRKGNRYKVFIEKISGSVAFCRIQP